MKQEQKKKKKLSKAGTTKAATSTPAPRTGTEDVSEVHAWNDMIELINLKVCHGHHRTILFTSTVLIPELPCLAIHFISSLVADTNDAEASNALANKVQRHFALPSRPIQSSKVHHSVETLDDCVVSLPSALVQSLSKGERGNTKHFSQVFNLCV
jgi:hypothetical protein